MRIDGDRGRKGTGIVIGFGFLGLIEFSVMTINKTSAIIDCTEKKAHYYKGSHKCCYKCQVENQLMIIRFSVRFSIR